MTVLHAIQHWIHDRPVTYVVWVCSALGLLAFLALGLPRAFRRFRVRGDRAPRRLAVFLALMLAGLGLLAWFDSGTRFSADSASAQPERTEFAQLLTASGQPFSVFAYHAVNLSLSANPAVLGVIPEFSASETWTNPQTAKPFVAPVLGLPTSFDASLFLNRLISPQIVNELATWQSRMRRLTPGHLYVDQATALAQGLKPGDTLEVAKASAGLTYWTVQGIVPRDELVDGPALVMPMRSARSLAGTVSGVSPLVLLLSAPRPSLPASDSQAIAAVTSRLPPHTASDPRPINRWQPPSAALSADWTRRLAVMALVLVVVGALGLRIVGRAGATGARAADTKRS